MTHVYLAEIHYDGYESDFLGIFSSTEKAQAACVADFEERSPTVEFPAWQARGDSVLAASGDCDYTILAVELDRRVL